MNRIFLPLFLLLVLSTVVINGCSNKGLTTSKSKYKYETIPNDPLGARIYTLNNGLKVYLSVNKKEPRIQTYVAVRAGSKSDPKETTGLAHYLEHMVFKGSHKIGTIDWEKEKVLLDEISALYEKHRNTTDPEQKKAVYHQIDSLSHEASKYAVPNEYDKMITSLGAKGTNAYTSVEQTVYVNDIPSNELEKWLMVESERFQTLVLRLFHTELETVYEEFNRGEDTDSRKSWKALNQGLFPNHPYGTQTTIGEGEHLKNPSMVNIHNYFDKYYIPNNVAICLSGDLDPDATIALIDKYFGSWKTKELKPTAFPKEAPLTKALEVNVSGVQPEHVRIGYRLDGAGSRDAMLGKLLGEVLSNGQAGLIDLNLNQKQVVLGASAYMNDMIDYSALILYGQPREGQTLQQVKDSLIAQIELVKQGKFDDWLMEACIKNLRLMRMQQLESNSSRAGYFVESFIQGTPWSDFVIELNEMSKISKQELIDWTKAKFGNNYVAVYKNFGEDPNRHKVEKPIITPVVMNRDSTSAFHAHFDSVQSSRLEAQFLDYDKLITETTLNNKLPLSYIKNEVNGLFSLYYILDMGTDNDQKLGLAIEYLPYLGTDKYTAEDLQKEFFKLGLSFDVYSSRDRVYVTLSGLNESFEQGVKLFEHLLTSVQPNDEALTDLVNGKLKLRSDNKKNKGAILNGGMVNYAKYGTKSPYTYQLSEQELKQLQGTDLVAQLKKLTSYKHRIFYYGNKDAKAVVSVLDQYHQVPANLADYPKPVTFPELDIKQNTVYFVHYDMKQTELYLITKGPIFDKGVMPYASIFNEYFGSGLSSIIFQEIRESKALAYSAYSYVSSPRLNSESHYIAAYIGTQADKLGDATGAMITLMNDMPQVNAQFLGAKDAALKKIESSRTVGEAIYWSREAARNRGLDYDLTKEVYNTIATMDVASLKNFFNTNIKGKNYTFLVLGNRKDVDMEVLKKLGPVQELTLEQVFGY
ncbi:insulinase family protein [soil metagenome]